MLRFLQTKTGWVVRAVWALFIVYMIYIAWTTDERPNWMALALLTFVLLMSIRPSLFYPAPDDLVARGDVSESTMPRNDKLTKGRPLLLISLPLFAFIGFIALTQVVESSGRDLWAVLILLISVYALFRTLRKLFQRSAEPAA